jgi:hypothetical protein
MHRDISGYMEKNLFSETESIPEMFSRILQYDREKRPYRYQWILFRQIEKENTGPAGLEKILPHIPARYRPVFFENLGMHWAETLPDFLSDSAALERLIPGEHQDAFYRGFTFYRVFIAEDFFQEVPLLDRRPSKYIQWMEFNLGRILASLSDEERYPQIAALMEPQGWNQKPWFYRGLGHEMATSWFLNDLRYEAALKFVPFEVPARFRDDFSWGTGSGIRESFPEDRLRALDAFRSLPPEERTPALEGLHYFERQFKLHE